MTEMPSKDAEMVVCRAIVYGFASTIPLPLVMGQEGSALATLTTICAAITLLGCMFLRMHGRSTIDGYRLAALTAAAREDPETARAMASLVSRTPPRVTHREYETIAAAHNERNNDALWLRARSEADRTTIIDPRVR